MLPTLRQLQYLKLLAHHGSFSRAAEAAHVTQPTLSAGVQELEKILGAPVVDRARSGVILTPVGEEALRRGSEILAQAEDLLQAARSAGQPLTGRFRLGVIPTVAPFLLPKVLHAVRARYPSLKLFLREDRTQALIAALKTGALDAAIIALPYDTTGLETASIGEDELLAALPANHARRRLAVGPGPDPAGRRPLPARPCPGRLWPGGSQDHGGRRRLRRDLPGDPGADGRRRPRRHLPASHGHRGRPDRPGSDLDKTAVRREGQPGDRDRLAGGV